MENKDELKKLEDKVDELTSQGLELNKKLRLDIKEKLVMYITGQQLLDMGYIFKNKITDMDKVEELSQKAVEEVINIVKEASLEATNKNMETVKSFSKKVKDNK